MKFCLILLIFTGSSFSCFCQDTSLTQDPKAEPYLNTIARNFTSEKAFQIEFRYEIYSAVEDATVADFGSLLIYKQMYKLRTEDSEALFNGKFMWVHNIPAGEVYKSEPESVESDQMLVNPFKLIGNYKDEFKYLLKGEEQIRGVSYTVIDLYPKKPGSSYSILRIHCRNKGAEIHSLAIHQKNGTKVSVFLTEIIPNIDIPESAFSWDSNANPDVLLIEM